MKRIKRWTAAVCCAVMLMAVPMTAEAAEIKDLFHAGFYAQTNPDLAKLYGNDEAGLYQHFITTGLQEGRVGSVMFDVNEYRKMYPDLEKLYGDNKIEYYRHYLENGVKEGRNSGGLIDPIVYADSYPDIKAACGYNIGALNNQFMSTGLAEGRFKGLQFNADCYAVLNPELAKQYKYEGYNPEVLFLQYLKEGMAAGKKGARAGKQYAYICREKDEHVIRNWRLFYAPDCTNPGVYKGNCEVCGDEETVIIPLIQGNHIDKNGDTKCDYCGKDD